MQGFVGLAVNPLSMVYLLLSWWLLLVQSQGLAVVELYSKLLVFQTV
jgi:hypothetical protein